MTNFQIKKLILPVAGSGKRLRPLTLKTPKNLLPLNGKPLLEYVLDEAVAAGIEEVVFIANPSNKKNFHDYVRKNGKRFPFRFHLRIQETPGGNGHALLSAGDIVKNEPFAVRFCDDVLLGEKPVLQSLIGLFKFYKSSVILLRRVPLRVVSRFGIVGAREVFRRPSGFKEKVYEINKVVEKPAPKTAPSNLAVLGGYVLTTSVFRNIQKVAEALPSVADDAIPINVGLQIELIVGGKIYGWEFIGRRLDCGTLESFRRAEKFLKKNHYCPEV